MAPNVVANSKDTAFKAILTEHEVEVVDLMMEWNKFDHLSYWEIAKEAIRKYDGIDGIFFNRPAGAALYAPGYESWEKSTRGPEGCNL